MQRAVSNHLFSLSGLFGAIITAELRPQRNKPWPGTQAQRFKPTAQVLNLEVGGSLKTSSVRILVVDDHIPFRKVVCSTLGKRPELQVIGEASDGLEAVQKAEELQPDLIVLDIGLPVLNGIEAARRIRMLAPRSKILFVSQESSDDVVREALSSGALGYVAKMQAGGELLAAVAAVLEDRQFVSRGLLRYHSADAADSDVLDRPCRDQALLSPVRREAQIPRNHKVEFYSDDAALVVGFASFAEAALRAGNGVVVASTESHRNRLLEKLQDCGVDMVTAIEQGRYRSLDVDDVLSTFMMNDMPDPVRFFEVVGGLIAAASAATGPQSRVAVCGECASILWAQGKADAAIQVEQLCNQLTKRYEMDILCGFSLSTFYREEDREVFQMICSGR
jgi:DNA-binding NarL/FixJ family response regulator